MLIACGIPIGVMVYVLKEQRKKTNSLEADLGLLSEILTEHMELDYQSKVDAMFSMLIDDLDDE